MATSRKPDFSLKSFQKLMNSFSSKYSGSKSDKLKEDWKKIVQTEFSLSDDQDKSFTNIPKTIDKELQKSFNEIADHVRTGGQINGMIILNNDRTHTMNLFLGTSKGSEGTMYKSIIIASCDANCRDWRWGRGRKK